MIGARNDDREVKYSILRKILRNCSRTTISFEICHGSLELTRFNTLTPFAAEQLATQEAKFQMRRELQLRRDIVPGRSVE